MKWMKSKDENHCRGGVARRTRAWSRSRRMRNFDLAEIKSLLERVAKSIHGERNRVKYTMNGFVIAVACFVKPLHKAAVDTATGIGKVTVDLVGDLRGFRSRRIGSEKFQARSPIGKKRKSPKC